VPQSITTSTGHKSVVAITMKRACAAAASERHTLPYLGCSNTLRSRLLGEGERGENRYSEQKFRAGLKRAKTIRERGSTRATFQGELQQNCSIS
jgi:hypothetical protein